MLTTDQILSAIDRMPPISPAAHRITELLARPRQSIKELSEAVQVDPVVTAQILKVCNSAYFSLPVKVVSVPHAINMLGAHRLVDIVLLGSSRSMMKRNLRGYGMSGLDLWEQSLTTALIARALALRCQMKRTSLLFTAGLLKDLGKVVLDRYIAKSGKPIKDLMVRSDYSHTEAEKTILGFDYLEVSLMIADKWHFPERLVNIIRGCRMGETAEFKEPEPAVVYLASARAQRQSVDDEIRMRDWRHCQSAQTFLALEADRVEEIDRGAREAVKNYRDMLAEA